MADALNFRSALSGFNREDVVKYIEYINAKHTAELNQLRSEIEYLNSKLSSIREDADAKARLDEVLAENEALRAQVEQLQTRCEDLETAPAAPAPQPQYLSGNLEQELEAYRRAARTERLARERAELIYHQTNSALADATVKVDEAAAQLGTMTDGILAQLNQLQNAISGSKQALHDAAATMYAIRPTNE